MREGPKEPPVERRPDQAANDDFTGSSNRRGAFAHEGGWDPYEIWRTRVKAPSVKARQGEEGRVQPAEEMGSLH